MLPIESLVVASLTQPFINVPDEFLKPLLLKFKPTDVED
jgi:hypothetical protein